MIRKNTILLITFALFAIGIRGQDSDGGVTGDCKVSFRAVLLQGANNVVNFYSDSLFFDPSVNLEPLWYWDFGDGEYSSEPSPVHTYNDDSKESYMVTLTVVFGDYCKSAYSQEVFPGSYNPLPCTASYYWYFNDSIKFFAEGYAISFTDKSWSNDSQVIEWLWDFGDGQTSNEQNPMHIYQPLNMSPLPPDFWVVLTIKTANGCESSFSQLVNLKPVYVPECQSYFYYEPASDIVTIPELIPIQFHDKSSGNVTGYFWDFGDGTTSSEIAPLHNYDFLNGPYVATLTITTDTGCISSYSEYIRTGTFGEECKPVFYYIQPDSFVNIPELVSYQFIDISEGDVIKRTWDFGDGTWSNDKAPVHNFYFKTGYAVVSLTIVTSTGCENTYSEYIYIGDPIIYPYDTCFYYINVITGENPLQDNLCNGTATASLFDYNGQQIDIEKFYWSNGDESISTGNLCFNNYYSVKTMTPNGCGVYADFTLYNGSYLDSGMVDPGIDWTTINDSLYYYFNYLYATDSSWVCVWDFGDGKTAEGANVSHEYADNGYYNVTLTIIDSDGVKVFSKAMEVNNATSVKSHQVAADYSIYPNPVGDVLNIKANSKASVPLSVSVIDITGKTLFTSTIEERATGSLLRIPVSGLHSGVYFAKIASVGGNPVILKFVK